MKIRTISTLGILATIVAVAFPGSAQSGSRLMSRPKAVPRSAGSVCGARAAKRQPVNQRLEAAAFVLMAKTFVRLGNECHACLEGVHGE